MCAKSTGGGGEPEAGRRPAGLRVNEGAVAEPVEHLERVAAVEVDLIVVPHEHVEARHALLEPRRHDLARLDEQLHRERVPHHPEVAEHGDVVVAAHLAHGRDAPQHLERGLGALRLEVQIGEDDHVDSPAPAISVLIVSSHPRSDACQSSGLCFSRSDRSLACESASSMISSICSSIAVSYSLSSSTPCSAPFCSSVSGISPMASSSDSDSSRSAS